MTKQTAPRLETSLYPNYPVRLEWCEGPSFHSIKCDFRTASYMWNVLLRVRSNVKKMTLFDINGTLLEFWKRET